MVLLSKTIIFEVLEVPGDDLETLSETKAGKGTLEARLRPAFFRFYQIFEILRVPWETILGQNSELFPDSIFDDFLKSFWEGPAAGADLP